MRIGTAYVAVAFFLLTSAALAQGSAEYGKDEFEAKCSKCHSIRAADGAGTGPNLHMILGTKAGAREGYVYSDALKNSAVVWDEEKLGQFLQGPGAVVPGNRMSASYGGTSAEISADIVAYLKAN
jgi:cytochrome c